MGLKAMSTWLLSFDRSVSDKTTGVNFGLLKLLPIEIFAPNLVSESPDIFTHYRVVVDGLICVQISVEERGLTQQTTTKKTWHAVSLYRTEFNSHVTISAGRANAWLSINPAAPWVRSLFRRCRLMMV